MDNNEIVKTLRDHDIRPTVQRVDIAKVIFSQNWHCTATEISEEVNKAMPRVARASIFNTIKLFEEKGLLKKLELSVAEAIYDSNIEKHHHLINKESNQVHDIKIPAELEEQLYKNIVQQASEKGLHLPAGLDIKINGFY